MNDQVIESIPATDVATNKLNLIHEAIQTTNDKMMARNRSNKYSSGGPRPDNNFNVIDKPRRRLHINNKNKNMNEGQAKENDCDSSCASKDGIIINDINEKNGHSKKKFMNNINCESSGGFLSDNGDDTGCHILGEKCNKNNDDDDNDEEINDDRDYIVITNRSLNKGNKNNIQYTPVRNTKGLEEDDRDLTDVSPAQPVRMQLILHVAVTWLIY